jgi:YD repeat-containing protein
MMKTFLACMLVATAAHGAVISYRYDAAGRLTAATYDGTTHLDYQYDRHGSLLVRRVGTDILPALAAAYTGLVIGPFPGSLNTGPITLKLLPAGGYSGSFILNGKKTSFRGTFAADGTSGPISLPGGITLNLALDVIDGTERITGTLSIGGEDSDVTLARAAFNAKTLPFPAGWIGKFTALLAPTDGDPVLYPQGDGYATGTISAKGSVRTAVRLGENTAFTQSATLAGPAANWPFFASLYKKAGYVTGTITFDAEADISDFSGMLTWLKPTTSGALHPTGFDTSLQWIGSKYLPPAKAQQVLSLRDASPNARFTLPAGALPGGSVLQNLTLDSQNKFNVSPPLTTTLLKIKTTPATGLTTGSLRDGTATFTFGGVVLQKQNLISGHVLGSTQSGPIEITPE